MILSLEGRTTDRHLVENGSDRPEVGLRVVLLVSKDLGSHVEPRRVKGPTRSESVDSFVDSLRWVKKNGTHGEPQSVSAMLAPSKNRANPKSATLRIGIPRG